MHGSGCEGVMQASWLAVTEIDEIDEPSMVSIDFR